MTSHMSYLCTDRYITNATYTLSLENFYFKLMQLQFLSQFCNYVIRLCESVAVTCTCGSPAQTSTSQLNFQIFPIHSERWKTTFSHNLLKATNYTQ